MPKARYEAMITRHRRALKVWQTGFNEMEKDGFGIEVPDVQKG